MKPAAPIRLLLVDDHPVVRAGLAAVLKFDARFQVIAEASDGVAAVEAHRKHQPDITLLNVRMPVMDGIEAARRIHAESPAARLLMLTTYDADEDIRLALDAGASGYLLKNSNQDGLIAALLTQAETARPSFKPSSEAAWGTSTSASCRHSMALPDLPATRPAPRTAP